MCNTHTHCLFCVLLGNTSLPEKWLFWWITFPPTEESNYQAAAITHDENRAVFNATPSHTHWDTLTQTKRHQKSKVQGPLGACSSSSLLRTQSSSGSALMRLLINSWRDGGNATIRPDSRWLCVCVWVRMWRADVKEAPRCEERRPRWHFDTLWKWMIPDLREEFCFLWRDRSFLPSFTGAGLVITGRLSPDLIASLRSMITSSSTEADWLLLDEEPLAFPRMTSSKSENKLWDAARPQTHQPGTETGKSFVFSFPKFF